MIWLIDKINKFAAYLLYKMANVMEVEIWMLLLKNDIMCDVKYQWNDNDTIRFYIITDGDLSIQQNQKVCDLIGRFNDEQYDGIVINPVVWSEEYYKSIYGED